MTVDNDVAAIAIVPVHAEVFSKVFDRHADAVRGYVSSRVSDRATVDDVMQDVFVRSYLAVGDLRDPNRFRPWLMAIARNACADEHRRRSRFIPLSDDEFDQPDGGPTSSDLAELTQLASLVRGCVAGLSSRDATALTMVVQFGLSVTELAATLGVTDGTARVILHRARRRLGAALVVSVLATTGGGCDRLQTLLEEHEFVNATMHALDCAECRISSA